MLIGISPILSPELLKVIAEMGHGDELIIGDGNAQSGLTGMYSPFRAAVPQLEVEVDRDQVLAKGANCFYAISGSTADTVELLLLRK